MSWMSDQPSWLEQLHPLLLVFSQARHLDLQAQVQPASLRNHVSGLVFQRHLVPLSPFPQT